jgi:hypothetical protein
MPAAHPHAAGRAVRVRLTRDDVRYYTWVQALARPVLPFLLYSFVLLTFASILGLWPAGRAFALAALIPLLGYLLWVWLVGRGLWSKYPQLRAPRTYRFGEAAYTIQTPENTVKVRYDELSRLVSSRRALYLVRRDGSADILPRSALPEGLEGWLQTKVPETERSSFL